MELKEAAENINKVGGYVVLILEIGSLLIITFVLFKAWT